MENQEMLKIGIGNEEAVTLKPSTVSIISVDIIEVGEKKAKKLVCSCKHPDATELIKISAVKYEAKGKLDTMGLWVNLDSNKMLKKGSALAVFLQALGCQRAEQLVGKGIPTCQDEKGYLVFKAY